MMLGCAAYVMAELHGAARPCKTCQHDVGCMGSCQSDALRLLTGTSQKGPHQRLYSILGRVAPAVCQVFIKLEYKVFTKG